MHYANLWWRRVAVPLLYRTLCALHEMTTAEADHSSRYLYEFTCNCKLTDTGKRWAERPAYRMKQLPACVSRLLRCAAAAVGSCRSRPVEQRVAVHDVQAALLPADLRRHPRQLACARGAQPPTCSAHLSLHVSQARSIACRSCIWIAVVAGAALGRAV